MNDNLITEIIDLNKVKANLTELKEMWEQLITTMSAKSTKDLKFDDVVKNLKLIKEAEEELRRTKQAGLEVDGKKVKITAEIIGNYEKYSKEDQKIIENEIKRKHEIRETNKLLKDKFTNEQDLVKILQRETKSIADLDKQNKDLQRIQQKLNLTTKEGIDANAKINAQIEKNKETTKEYTNVIDKQRRNVGNYKSAFEAFEKGSTNLRGALKLVKDELSELEVKVVAGIQLTEEEQRAYERLRNELGQLTDVQENVSAQAKILSDDYRQMNAALETVAVGASAFGVAQGAMALFGSENEKVARSLQKLVAVQTMLTSIQKLQNSLNKDGRIMIELQTLAQSKNTVVKGIATAVTRGLNTVLTSTNLLIGGGIALLGLAIVGISKHIKKSREMTDSQMEVKKAEEEAQKATEEHTKAIEDQEVAYKNLQDAIEGVISGKQMSITEIKAKIGLDNLNSVFEEAQKAYENYMVTFSNYIYDRSDENLELHTEATKEMRHYLDLFQDFRKVTKAGTQTSGVGLFGNITADFGEDAFAKIIQKYNEYIAELMKNFKKNTKKIEDEAIDPLKKLIEEQSIEMSKINIKFIEAQNELYNEFEAGIISYEDYLDKIEKLEKKYFEGGIEIQIEHLEQQKSLMEEGSKEFVEANEKIAKLQNNLNKENLKAFEKWLSNLKSLQTQEITAKNIEYLNSQRAIHEEMRDGLLTFSEYNEKLEQLEFEHFINSTKQQIEQLIKLNETLKDTDYKEYQQNLEKIAQLENDLAKASVSVVESIEEEEKATKKFKDYLNEFLGVEEIENWRDTFIESITSVANESFELYNQIIDLQNEKLYQELDNLNKLYDKQVSGLESAYDMRKKLLEATIDDEAELAAELARIEEEKTAAFTQAQDTKLAKEQEVAKQQAILAKKKAEMEVAAGSASALVEAIKLIGIATTTAAPGDPYSLVARIAAALAAALTVVTATTTGIAKVKAIGIPQFWAGGEAQEGQLISVAERGKELAVGESGKSYMFDKQSIIVAPEKMRIFSNKETKQIMEKQTINNTYEKQSNVNLTIAIDNERHKKYFKLN